MKVVIRFKLLVCLLQTVFSLNNPGSSVYVVTPSSKTNSYEGRSAPFYYHNWRRRMDPPKNFTTTTTVKTPDLIFAEFESDAANNMKKSIRNLLEKERVKQKTTTTTTSPSTLQPIYVPDKDSIDINQDASMKTEEFRNSESEAPEKFYVIDKQYNNFPAPIYLPSTTTTTLPPQHVENIWHIIDNEKHDQYSGKWEEVPVGSSDKQINPDESKSQQEADEEQKLKSEEDVIDDNFAFPGFGLNAGNGAENESRAIRVDPNIRFPYVNLKPFQMKNTKNAFSYSKKSNNMFNLDNFKEIQNPVRGEVQDTNPFGQPIDRYNPAQPYLPHDYSSKSKQSSPPTKTVANLVPPPPPPPPKVTGDDFPAPTSYESFPPFAVPTADVSPPVASPPISYQPPKGDSQSYSFQSGDSDDSPLDSGYQYKPPKSSFRPTLPPLSKPFDGYSYNKPASSNDDSPPPTNQAGYSYRKPIMTMDSPPPMDMGGQEDSPPMTDDKPDFHGYHYDKPPPLDDHPPSSYKPHEPSPYHHDSDYPELIFDKPHGGSGPVKGGGGMKDDGAGMMPPPPPADMKPDSGPPMDDSGFPPGFPGDFKLHHDFDDHDFYHHHHHPTTTTTTESPRVNRYSYYYLGKKLYYLPLYFSVYFIVYVGALIIKAILRHKIVYPNSWRPNDTTSSFFSKRSVDSWDLSNENLHEITGRVTKAIGEAAEKYANKKHKEN